MKTPIGYIELKMAAENEIASLDLDIRKEDEKIQASMGRKAKLIEKKTERETFLRVLGEMGGTTKESEKGEISAKQSVAAKSEVKLNNKDLVLNFLKANAGKGGPFEPSEIVKGIGIDKEAKAGGIRTTINELHNSGKIRRKKVNGNTYAYHLESVFLERKIEMAPTKKATPQS